MSSYAPSRHKHTSKSNSHNGSSRRGISKRKSYEKDKGNSERSKGNAGKDLSSNAKPQERRRNVKSQEQWDATARAHRLWRASHSTSSTDPAHDEHLRNVINEEFKKIELVEPTYFYDMALQWKTLHAMASSLAAGASTTERSRLLELVDWPDSGDRHSLCVTRILENVSTGLALTADCRLDSVDLLRIHKSRSVYYTTFEHC